MELRDIEHRMRAREAAHEEVIGDGTYIVVRLDGRGFTALSRELELEKPFDIGFRDHMVAAARHLMGCGFRTVYGHTQSDEISLVLDRGHDAFGRRRQKTVSVLAGEASAALALALGTHAVFDARVLALEGVDEVVDYLHWRQGDARRNARVLYGYWLLRGQGASARQATRTLHRLWGRANRRRCFASAPASSLRMCPLGSSAAWGCGTRPSSGWERTRARVGRRWRCGARSGQRRRFPPGRHMGGGCAAWLTRRQRTAGRRHARARAPEGLEVRNTPRRIVGREPQGGHARRAQ